MENNNTETPYLLKQPVFRDNRGLFAPIKLNDNWTQSNIIVNNSIFRSNGRIRHNRSSRNNIFVFKFIIIYDWK